MSKIYLQNKKIAIIGLGYVGLPLAVEFGKRRKVIGFDLNEARISELITGEDRILEVEPDELAANQPFFMRPVKLLIAAFLSSCADAN